MDPRDEAADLNKNPIPPEPDCSTCLYCFRPESSCELRELDPNRKSNVCDYKPNEYHDDSLPPLEQAHLIQLRIQALQEEVKGFQSRYENLIEKAVAANLEKEGSYSLIDKKRTVRVPDPEKFREQFAEEYAILKQELIESELKKIDRVRESDLTTIPVKRAEELIGKVKLTKISEEKVYHSYSIVLVEA